MNCCQHCQATETVFGDKTAQRQLRKYRNKGPDKSTQILIDALTAEGLDDLTLLDIGAGVGTLHLELLKAGASRATDVDAASEYLDAAQREAERQDLVDRVTYQHGNFVDLAPDIERADIVTLDRVICCYPDMEALVGLSAERAAKLYGAVFPRDRWWVRMGLALGNFFLWFSRNPFRTFVHPENDIDATLRASGLQRRFYRNAGIIWQIVVYGRNGAA